MERVLVKELARTARFDMAAAEFGAVAFERLDLLLCEHEGVAPGMFLKPQQSLEPGFEAVSLPHPADAGGAHGGALEWTRPSDHDRTWHTADDRLILYETRFRSQGALKSLESGSRTGRPPRPRRLPMGIRQRVEQRGEPRRGIRAMG